MPIGVCLHAFDNILMFSSKICLDFDHMDYDIHMEL